MSPSRRVRRSALVLAALATVMSAVPSSAQSYEDAQRSAELSPDPLLRSPRMLGFGRLEWVIDDPHHRFTMWDFAGNPTGVALADSGSTFEVRPRTGSNSTLYDAGSGSGPTERQTLAARDFGVGFEAWRRTSPQTAYGVVGEVRSIRVDNVVGDATEMRRNVSVPDVTAIFNGPMPYVLTRQMKYALRLNYGVEGLRDEYRTIVRNAAGEYIDRNGDTLDPPSLFTPDEITTTRLGGGVATSYDFGRTLTAAIGYDFSQQRVEGENAGDRYDSKTHENRPYHIGQASVIGRFGPHLELGADARGWTSSSEADWFFTISAGVGGIPLTGRGKLEGRDEEGSALRARARWSQGPLELGAGLSTAYRQVQITAPDPGDLSSLNYFLDNVYYRPNADSLALPDSVVDVTREERRWEAGGGLAWKRLPYHALLGAEFHAWRDLGQSTLGGLGPKQVGWDVRSGLEVPLNPVLTTRGGYIYRWQDDDDLTSGNEYVTHSITLGLSLRPMGAAWTMESGYVAEWMRNDFPDPGRPRAGRQLIATQFRWVF